MYVDITDYLNAAIQSGTLPNLSFAIQSYSDNNNSAYVKTAATNTTINFLSKEFKNYEAKTVDSLAPSIVIYYTPSTTPVTSSQLLAVKSGKTVNLSWKTYTEINSSKFYVERSADGVSYTTIDRPKCSPYEYVGN